MKQVADINTKLQGLSANDPSAATLMDQRDQAINTLSKLCRRARHHRRIEPGQPLHHDGHPAGRRRACLAIHLRLGRRAVGDLALQHRSDQVRRRRAQHQAAERLAGRRRRQQRGVLRPDRGRPQAARPDTGAGAEPDRPARRHDVERAVRQDHIAGTHGLGSTPAGLRSRARRLRIRAIPSTSPTPTRRPTPSARSRWSTSPIRRRCRCRTRPTPTRCGSA